MYKLLNGKQIYEKDEVDSVIATVVDDSHTARILAEAADTKATTALALSEAIQDDVTTAIEKATEAYDRVDSFNTVINTTLEAATNAVEAAMEAKTEITDAVYEASRAADIAEAATAACTKALTAVAESDKKANTAISTANTANTKATNAISIASNALTVAGDAVHTANSAHESATQSKNELDSIKALIPEQATTSNKIADKAFVNSSIQTATANFRGEWATWSAVPTTVDSYPEDYAGGHKPTVNDYISIRDASGYGESYAGTWRFKYTGNWDTLGKDGWEPEYQVNETPMTAEQIAALNSGITEEDVAKLNGLKNVVVVSETEPIEPNCLLWVKI